MEREGHLFGDLYEKGQQESSEFKDQIALATPHVEHRNSSLVFPFFLWEFEREGHATQGYRDEDHVNSEPTQPIIL